VCVCVCVCVCACMCACVCTCVRILVYFSAVTYLCICIHTYTHLTALFPGLPRWAGTRKVKPIRILLKQETVSGSGISWAICKSAPHSRQITMPAPHPTTQFFTGRVPFLPSSQQRLKALNASTMRLFPRRPISDCMVMFRSCKESCPKSPYLAIWLEPVQCHVQHNRNIIMQSCIKMTKRDCEIQPWSEMTIVDTFITNFMNKNYIWRMCFLLLQYSCLKQSSISFIWYWC